MNTHRQYINEQIRKEPKFAEALAKADHEVGIAMELAKFMSSLFPYAAWGRRRFVARGRRGP